jgi:TetR/AcrR family transcriptional regulator, regulator of autoinduction and epiphytic fitness
MSSPAAGAAPRTSFRQQILRVREDAIVSAVNRLLAEKGFEAMTVDEVAAEVGIAKASLYKHFPSKEELAAAAMVLVLDRALAFLDQERARPGSAAEHLRAVVRWMLRAQIAGEMPALPAQNSTLRTALMQHRTYLERVMTVSERLGEWITAAQAAGQIDARLPPEAVLYTLYARACDPVLAFLRAGGRLSDEEVVEVVLSTCFDGLTART